MDKIQVFADKNFLEKANVIQKGPKDTDISLEVPDLWQTTCIDPKRKIGFQSFKDGKKTYLIYTIDKIDVNREIQNCWEYHDCQVKEDCTVFRDKLDPECWMVYHLCNRTKASPKIKNCYHNCWECPWFRKFNQENNLLNNNCG